MEGPQVGEQPIAVSKRPSLAVNSFARLMSDVALVLFGLFAGVITARVLTPSGKGTYAVLSFLVIALGQISTLGLGDAATIMIGKNEISLQRAFSASVIPVLVGSIVGTSGLIIVANLFLGGNTVPVGRSAVVAAMTVPVYALYHLSTFLADSQERIVATSIVRGTVQLVTLLALVVFLLLYPLHVTGAMLAGAVGVCAGFAITLVILKRMGLRLRVAWDRDFLVSALRKGIAIQLAYVMMSLSTRIDALFVYSFAGRAEAGRYSVALTVGFLGAYASVALALALFPRLSRLDEVDAGELIIRASRVGIAASLVAAGAIGCSIPVLVPLVFGEAYSGSVLPALILLLGGVIWAEQYLLARAQLARGETDLQLRSFGAGLVVMVGLDVALIPRYELIGASIASVAGAAVGLGICLRAYKDLIGGEGNMLQLLPRRDDFKTLVGFGRQLSRRIRGRTS